MKKIIAFLLILSLSSAFLGCGNKGEVLSSQEENSSFLSKEEELLSSQPEISVSEESSASEESSQESHERIDPVTVRFNTMEGTVYHKEDQNAALILYSYSYPVLENPEGEPALDVVTQRYQSAAEAYLAALRGAAADDAAAFYQEDKENFQPDTYECGCDITYNQRGLLSIRQQQYTYSGGAAYPLILMTSATFDLTDGHELSLGELTGLSEEEAYRQAADLLYQRVSENPDGYYETDWDQLAYALATGGEYYLYQKETGEEMVAVYLQESSIAPHAAGLIVVELPAASPEDSGR